MPNRKLLRVSVPVRLDRLQQLLAAVDCNDPANTIVLHHNRELIVEEPEAVLELAEADGSEQ